MIGVDVEIRPHNKAAIDAHELRPLIETVEGDSIAPETVARVKALIRPGERVLLLLDSKHTREHVLGELRAYADLVPAGSWIVVADGIMRDVVGAPRTQPEWSHDNPVARGRRLPRRAPPVRARRPTSPLRREPGRGHEPDLLPRRLAAPGALNAPAQRRLQGRNDLSACLCVSPSASSVSCGTALARAATAS